jgi:hypothetical protein
MHLHRETLRRTKRPPTTEPVDLPRVVVPAAHRKKRTVLPVTEVAAEVEVGAEAKVEMRLPRTTKDVSNLVNPLKCRALSSHEEDNHKDLLGKKEHKNKHKNHHGHLDNQGNRQNQSSNVRNDNHDGNHARPKAMQPRAMQPRTIIPRATAVVLLIERMDRTTARCWMVIRTTEEQNNKVNPHHDKGNNHHNNNVSNKRTGNANAKQMRLFLANKRGPQHDNPATSGLEINLK